MYSSVSGMIEQTLCPLQEGQKFHKLQCQRRECEECGVEKLILLPDVKDESDNHEVK